MDYVKLTFHEVVQLCHECWGDDIAEAIRRADSFSGMTHAGRVIKTGTGFDSTFEFPARYWTRSAASSSGIASSGTASSAWVSYSSMPTSAISSTTGGAQVVLKPATSTTTGWIKKPPTDPVRPSAYQASSILAMPLPTVAAAVAPLAGVALGADMYSQNPELWTKLSRALIPWAYPDNPIEEGLVDVSKGLMPIWTDVAEAGGELIARALLPDFIVDAVKQFFQDEGIGGGTGEGYDEYESTYNGKYVPYSGGHLEYTDARGFRYVYDAPGAYFYRADNEAICGAILVGRGPITFHWKWYNQAGGLIQEDTTTYNNNVTLADGSRAVAAAGLGFGSIGTNLPTFDRTGLATRDKVASVILLGNQRRVAYYPEGTSQWGDGTIYPLPQNPTQLVLQNPDGTERLVDTYPLPLPLSPGQSPDSTVQPIDNPLVDTSKQADPYIQQTPDPYSEPAPTSDVKTDPKADPSDRTEPSSPLSPDTPTPTPPSSDGDSPPALPPIIPPPFTSQGGLIAVYNPSQSILVDFANWLWVTYNDATIQKIWNNPFDGVISLHELYATPPVVGTRNIKSGFLDSEISCPIIDRYTEINCGSIVIPEFWCNYLDYAPYSKAFVYLPFIGIIELECDDIVGHAVNITYKIDCYNGSCIAIITVAKQGPDGSVYNNSVYQFSGNCAVEVPLTGGSQARIKAAIVNATAWGLGSVISGLVTASGKSPIAGLSGAGEAITGALQATASVVNAKSSVQHSGSFGASFGAMGIKTPYIIVKRPIQVQVLNYNELYGYQAHKAVTIGSCSGYLRCREVHVVSATASDEEKIKIENLLKTGIII